MYKITSLLLDYPRILLDYRHSWIIHRLAIDHLEITHELLRLPNEDIIHGLKRLHTNYQRLPMDCSLLLDYPEIMAVLSRDYSYSWVSPCFLRFLAWSLLYSCLVQKNWVRTQFPLKKHSRQMNILCYFFVCFKLNSFGYQNVTVHIMVITENFYNTSGSTKHE